MLPFSLLRLQHWLCFIKTISNVNHIKYPWWNCVYKTSTFESSKIKISLSYAQDKILQGTKCVALFKNKSNWFVAAEGGCMSVECQLEYTLAFLTHLSLEGFISKTHLWRVLEIGVADFVLKLCYYIFSQTNPWKSVFRKYMTEKYHGEELP